MHRDVVLVERRDEFLTEPPRQQQREVGDRRRRIEDHRIGRLLAGEGQELANQGDATVGGAADLDDVAMGGVAFAAGFFGPIIFTPEANQGPLLGIFITGPLGFVIGMGIGVWREARRASREKNVVKGPRP